MTQTVQKLNTLTQRTEYCLDRFPDTRNSDIDLFARLAENFYPPFERPLHNWRDLAHAMHSVPSLDHIARCRRKVVENHKYKKYLPTDRAIAEARGINREVWTQYAKQNNIPFPKQRSNIPEGYNQDGEFIGHGN